MPHVKFAVWPLVCVAICLLTAGCDHPAPAPKNAMEYKQRAVARFYEGEFDKAIEDFNQVIRLNPQDAQAFHGRGDAWYGKGEYDKAIEDFSKAIRLLLAQHQLVPFPYLSRGNAWYRKGEYDKAIKDYNQAIQIDRSFFIPYDQLAWILATCPDDTYRDGQRAIDNAEKAGKLGVGRENMFIHYDVLAAAYAEAGKFEAAVKWQTKAIEVTPSEISANVQLHSPAKIRTRLELYKAGKPYREEPKK